MPDQYALRCEQCNTINPAEAKHAGSTLPCLQCGVLMEVPKLRLLKQLEQIQTAPTNTKRGWGRLSGSLFAAGILLIAIALGSGMYVNQLKQNYAAFAEKPKLDNFKYDRDILTASLTDTWMAWEQLSKNPSISQRTTPMFVRAGNAVKRMDKWLKFFYALATVGLLSCISSLFCRPKVNQ